MDKGPSCVETELKVGVVVSEGHCSKPHKLTGWLNIFFSLSSEEEKSEIKVLDMPSLKFLGERSFLAFP